MEIIFCVFAGLGILFVAGSLWLEWRQWRAKWRQMGKDAKEKKRGPIIDIKN